MEYSLQRLLHHLPGKIKSPEVTNTPASIKEKFLNFLQFVKSIGATTALDDNEKRKLGIFNQLNFFQLVTGIIVPIAGFFFSQKFPAAAWPVAVLPAIISFLVMVLNARHKYHTALLCYFIFYPVFTCIIYINGMNLGIELSFVLYGILSVFFYRILAICFLL